MSADGPDQGGDDSAFGRERGSGGDAERSTFRYGRAASQRLQKVLAHAGVASRRASEELIAAGRVTVNGRVVTELGTCVRPGVDELCVDGQPLDLRVHQRYYLLYKPPGHLSTVSDTRGRRTARDLVPSRERLFPVGRLDLDSEGLLLFTNDGELTQRLTHPRYEHEKEYLVLVRGVVGEAIVNRMRRGILLEEEGATARARVRTHARGWTWRDQHLPKGGQWVTVVLREGRKRQIRRMFEATGVEVLRLIRVRMGPLTLGALQPGQGRWLGEREARELRRSVGL